MHEGWEALREAAREQAGYQASEDLVTRFLELLGAAITSGRAHIADATDGTVPVNPTAWGWRLHTVGTGDTERQEWRAQGERIAWLSGNDLLLHPDAAYAAAQKLARDQGTSLPVTQRTLWRRLDERGLLVVEEEARQRRLTPKRQVEGQRRRVLVLNPEALISQDRGNRDEAASGAGFRAQNAPLSLEQTGAQAGENRGTDAVLPLKQLRAPLSSEPQGRDSEPESLVPQGPAPSAPVAPEVDGLAPQGFSAAPCPSCGFTTLWRDDDGRLHCGRCEIPEPDAVVEFVEVQA